MNHMIAGFRNLLVLGSFPVIAVAADVFDSPGPGYHQQIEQIRRASGRTEIEPVVPRVNGSVLLGTRITLGLDVVFPPFDAGALFSQPIHLFAPTKMRQVSQGTGTIRVETKKSR